MTGSMKRLALGLVLALATSAAANAEPVRLRLAWVVPVANWGSMLLEKKDLARHLGQSYVLEPVNFTGTPAMITAIASGDLEIASFAFSSLALAIENAGLDDLRIVSDEFQDGVEGYYSDEYLVRNDAPIHAVADLKGKVLATNAEGSAVDIAMRAMLQTNGLDPKRDVNIVEAAFPTMRAMLGEKKVDLIPAVLPFSRNPELRAMAHPLFTQKDAVGKMKIDLQSGDYMVAGDLDVKLCVAAK